MDNETILHEEVFQSSFFTAKQVSAITHTPPGTLTSWVSGGRIYGISPRAKRGGPARLFSYKEMFYIGLTNFLYATGIDTIDICHRYKNDLPDCYDKVRKRTAETGDVFLIYALRSDGRQLTAMGSVAKGWPIAWGGEIIASQQINISHVDRLLLKNTINFCDAEIARLRCEQETDAPCAADKPLRQVRKETTNVA
ncbi:MAG: hypothetical protein ACOYMG_12610 [Candidatus Methylumidiphilus sp.]